MLCFQRKMWGFFSCIYKTLEDTDKWGNINATEEGHPQESGVSMARDGHANDQHLAEYGEHAKNALRLAALEYSSVIS